MIYLHNPYKFEIKYPFFVVSTKTWERQFLTLLFDNSSAQGTFIDKGTNRPKIATTKWEASPEVATLHQHPRKNWI